jgi:hypothetical protein
MIRIRTLLVCHSKILLDFFNFVKKYCIKSYVNITEYPSMRNFYEISMTCKRIRNMYTKSHTKHIRIRILIFVCMGNLHSKAIFTWFLSKHLSQITAGTVFCFLVQDSILAHLQFDCHCWVDRYCISKSYSNISLHYMYSYYLSTVFYVR